MKRLPLQLLASLLAFALAHTVAAQEQLPLSGTWELIPGKSADIGFYGTLTVEFRRSEEGLTILQTWGTRGGYRDSVTLVPGGSAVEAPVSRWVFPSNVFMGVRAGEGQKRQLSARWITPGRVLRVEEASVLRGSQRSVPLRTVHTYELSTDGDILTYRMERSTRTSGPPVRYVLKRAGTGKAYTIRIRDDWEVTGGLALNAMMISLQGLANRSGPHVYLLYPENWPFTYVNSVYDFYKAKRHFTFAELKTPAHALQVLKQYARGYVVWDTNVRTSLIVAFTVAGLEDAVVVSEELIPIAEKAGLKRIEDFRGKFQGQSDAQIYTWARDRYWSRCSKEFIIWLGGEHGTIMRPAVADWGVAKRVFFNDLSCRISDSAEYSLAKSLLADMPPFSMVMGWHSYAKDLEEEFVTLTSHYGHRVEGLHTLPNLSFSAQVPVSPGFTFKNNHHVRPGETLTPKKKVYISCIQTDGIGLGAWLEPGRGEIPYAWEVLMNYTWMAPGMAEYFYTMATPNDYFIGCLSGPGYLYPKAVPPDLLTKLIAIARDQMKTLDLRVFETMDWSEGNEVEGNTDLTAEVMDKYYSGMPEAIGFVNGYGPGYTFAVRDGRPFISYDYYLSPERPEAAAVADLQELATINAKRPYFLLVHVREWSNVKRVKGILDKLGPEFEIVPLDVFLTMAGTAPTFEERVLQRGEARGPMGQ